MYIFCVLSQIRHSDAEMVRKRHVVHGSGIGYQTSLVAINLAQIIAIHTLQIFVVLFSARQTGKHIFKLYTHNPSSRIERVNINCLFLVFVCLIDGTFLMMIIVLRFFLFVLFTLKCL